MLRSWWRQALVVCLFLLIASCSGGGCSSGCASCGITPIAGGFDPSQTIANSASVRVTKPGLEFLGGSIPGLAASLLGHGATGGIIDFDVPTTPISTSVIGISINLSVCPNGANTTTNPLQCVAEIEIGSASLAINSVTPDAITISGTIPVRIQELIITGNVPLLGNIQIDLGVGSNLGCDSNAGAVAAGVGFYGFPDHRHTAARRGDHPAAPRVHEDRRRECDRQPDDRIRASWWRAARTRGSAATS